MAEILKGAPVAKALSASLSERSATLVKEGILPTLCILRVGEKGSDISYETGAMKRAEAAGVRVVRKQLPGDCTKEELLSELQKINEDSTIHGCLLFRPLSDPETEREACELLLPKKDVDCMTDGSLFRVFSGKGEGYPPCTAEACMEILHYYGIPVSGKRAAVIGRSLVVGRPLAMMLLAENATVTVCHRKTEDLPGLCRQADILISAAGNPGFVTADFLREGQTVIDVGISVSPEGKLLGDVDFSAAEPMVRALTPVPGGVGSVTTAVLMKHVIEAAEKTRTER